MSLRTALLVFFILFLSCKKEKQAIIDNYIQVENPEVYELSNIIHALTNYGLMDNNQVKKDIPEHQWIPYVATILEVNILHT